MKRTILICDVCGQETEKNHCRYVHTETFNDCFGMRVTEICSECAKKTNDEFKKSLEILMEGKT
jgi:hypothetical protein